MRVNLDDLRTMVGLPYSKETEKIIQKTQQLIAEAWLDAGIDVVLDNTNVHTPEWAKKYEVVHLNFDATLEELISRDALRPAPVGEEVIKKFINLFKQRNEADTLPSQG